MDYLNILFIVVIFLLLYFVILNWYKKVKSSKAIKQRFERGRLLEYQANEFLVSNGYQIIDEQKEFKHVYYVDGLDKSASIKVDYVVSKNGKRYIVEVKSGKSAISTTNINTRRQLLEYSFAIPSDGVFLLNMENQKMESIEFIPIKERSNIDLIKFILVISLIGIIIPFWKIKFVFILLLVALFFLKPRHMEYLSEKLFSLKNKIMN